MSQEHDKTFIKADEDAALWAAKLEGAELSADESQKLRDWLAADPRHRALLTSYCQFSADLELPLGVLADEGVLTLPANKTEQPRSLFGWVAGSALATAACGLLLFYILGRQPSAEHFSAPLGQRQSVSLADGTKVELNAHSSLNVELSSGERRVRLADGEAFFQVAKDEHRPFFVETPSGSVRVTGTSFNVQSRTADQLKVTVLEGSVQVRPAPIDGVPPPPPKALVPGDELVAGRSGVSIRHLDETKLRNSLAWRQGYVVFEGAALSEALDCFAHYHGRGLSATPAAAKLKIGGRYSLDDVEGFLSALEDIWSVRVTREASGSVRIGLSNEP